MAPRATLVLLALLPFVAAAAAVPSVRLTVSYCPTAFSGLGGVVDVPADGNGHFSVVSHHWEFPGGLGCPENSDPNFLADGNTVYLDFGTEWGTMVEVAAGTDGNRTRVLKASVGGPEEFDGFTSFEVDGGKWVGITPAAAQHGWCNDGCFAFGAEDMTTGAYVPLSLLPWKAAMTNVAVISEGKYYFQGSYNLQPACSPVQTDECLISVDVATGKLVTSVGPNPYTVYGFHDAPADNKVLAWVYDDHSCPNGLNSFGFATVDLVSGNATHISCMDKSVSINTNPNTSGFDATGTMFATASGNSETGEVQVVVLDVATGRKLLDSSLPGLKKALGVGNVAPFINVWGISWTQ